MKNKNLIIKQIRWYYNEFDKKFLYDARIEMNSKIILDSNATYGKDEPFDTIRELIYKYDSTVVSNQEIIEVLKYLYDDKKLVAFDSYNIDSKADIKELIPTQSFLCKKNFWSWNNIKWVTTTIIAIAAIIIAIVK